MSEKPEKPKPVVRTSPFVRHGLHMKVVGGKIEYRAKSSTGDRS